ncbi:MAG: integrase, partial [Gemmatimonadetes bacterium]|nr:integrase [Gemmatimonadota bacterium]
MLERYFARPQTVDRIHASWLGPAIEQCATWLIARGHAAKNLARYVPIQMHFAAFAQARGATRYEDLPAHVDSFVSDWIARPDHRRAPGTPRPRLTQEIRWPIEQMLRLVVPGYVGHTRRRVL